MMMKFLIGAATLALMTVNPASAQLLGGGGGGMLGGSLGSMGGGLGGGGNLGGTFGGMGHLPSTVSDSAARTSSTGHAEKSVNRRNGHVSASGGVSSDSALASTSSAAGRSIGGTGAASLAGNGSADAQLVGTDTVRNVGTRAAGTARSASSQATGTARSTAQRTRDGMSFAADRVPGVPTGSVSGSGNAMLSGTMEPAAARAQAAPAADTPAQ